MFRGFRKWIYLAAGILVMASGIFLMLKMNTKAAAPSAQQTTVQAKKGDISSSVSGTSQLAARDIQNIVTPAEGTIQQLNLTSNKEVAKDSVLLQLTVPALDTALQQAQLDLAAAERQLADLVDQQQHMTLTAPVSGKITWAGNMDIGSAVSKTSKIATISDVSQMTVSLAFPVAVAVQLKKGDPVDLTTDGYTLTRTGTMESLGTAIKADAKGDRLVDVTVLVANDGTLDAGMKVKGSVNVGGLDVESSADNTLDFVNSQAFLAGVTGNIKELKVKSGATVKQGDVIATFFNDASKDQIATQQASVERSKLSVQAAQNKVDALKVSVPFDGVFSTDFVTDKTVKNSLANYPVGATIASGTTLGAVASLDVMKLVIPVDELDLTSIQAGQKAIIRVDALTGQNFTGEVSQVSTVGTTTNGVTTYDVVISVKNTDKKDLKVGMTATANILVQDKKGIVTLPIQAVQSQRGKRYVTLKKADGTLEELHEVKTGIRSQTVIEITEGLKDGDTVVVPQTTQRTQTGQQNPAGGGFQGGGNFGGGGNFQGGGGGNVGNNAGNAGNAGNADRNAGNGGDRARGN